MKKDEALIVPSINQEERNSGIWVEGHIKEELWGYPSYTY